MIERIPRHIIGVAVMLIAIGILAGLFFVPIPESNREVALVILGVAIGWAGSVVDYHFGTSAGSVRKTEIMKERKF
jgi:hypothetical protein